MSEFIGRPPVEGETPEEASKRCTQNMVDAVLRMGKEKPKDLFGMLDIILAHCGDNIKGIRLSGTERRPVHDPTRN